ncbi:rCG23176 [Rattus norvegicus]|uniref:RCG23176 n=1 Tax=Rattus norvegicus TaxID=10116 RepID=A6KGA7_RAT|nr:rCG23176 [Rattus norvegicus]
MVFWPVASHLPHSYTSFGEGNDEQVVIRCCHLCSQRSSSWWFISMLES